MREIKSKGNKTTFKKGHLGMVGNANPLWKGEDAGYGSKHDWIKLHFGKPSKCEHCGTATAKIYDWANISGKYLRVREDWIRLCRPCHHKMDGRGGKTRGTRIAKNGKPCKECGAITTSKHELCPPHLKKMFNDRRSIHARYSLQSLAY